MQWAQALDKGPWLQMYKVPGKCTTLGWQNTEGSPSWTWQAGGSSSFCYLGDMLSVASGCEFSTTTCMKTAWKKFKELLPVLSSHHLSLKTRGHDCVQLLCAECNAPCQWDLAIDKAKSPTSAAKWQGNDQTDLQCQAARHCHHQIQWATCAAWHWGSEGEKAPLVWTCGMLQWCSQDTVTTRSNELLLQLGIEDLDLILKERRLSWYGHVERSNGAVKTAFDIQVDGKRGPGRPKMTWKQLTEGLQRMEALGHRPSW